MHCHVIVICEVEKRKEKKKKREGKKKVEGEEEKMKPVSSFSFFWGDKNVFFSKLEKRLREVKVAISCSFFLW